MRVSAAGRRALLAAVALLLWGAVPASAQAPGEVTGLTVDVAGQMSWSPVAGADTYHVYRDAGSDLGALGQAMACHDFEAGAGPWGITEDPLPGQALAFLVTADTLAEGEGTPGTRSDAAPRYLQGPCRTLMTHHALNRAGLGWSQWERDRIAALGGLDAYLDEQLYPETIPENTDAGMSIYLSQHDPPVDAVDLIARHVIYSNYSRRQLAYKLTLFWFNHFNTDWEKLRDYYQVLFPSCDVSSEPACDPEFPYRAGLTGTGHQDKDLGRIHDLALNGTFRQMLEVGSLSSAMILYLDAYLSVAGSPNENQPRELLELHSLGVDGGYTQQDVEELSRVMTGWSVCKHETAELDNPLAPCVADYWASLPQGKFTTHFDITQHDCTPKTLFAGTPQEVFLPGTAGCSSAADAQAALDEFDTALDVVASHPATSRFISRKLIELLVTDEPTEAMIDQVVAAWNDPSNPNGVGDLREVTRAVLSLDAMWDPQLVGSKIKTPLEQFVTSMRAFNGASDGSSVILGSLRDAQHLLFYNEIPTGFSERGGDWIGTGNTLERQNWGINLSHIDYLLGFGINPVTVLNGMGVDTSPGNADEIVDALSELLFGGRLDPSSRQVAIEFLSTDDSGAPSPYNSYRIRQTVALMLGYPHFQEQ